MITTTDKNKCGKENEDKILVGLNLIVHFFAKIFLPI
jgi:hypothetical protein